MEYSTSTYPPYHTIVDAPEYICIKVFVDKFYGGIYLLMRTVHHKSYDRFRLTRIQIQYEAFLGRIAFFISLINININAVENIDILHAIY